MGDWKQQDEMSEEENIRMLEMPCEERYKIMESWEHKGLFLFCFG